MAWLTYLVDSYWHACGLVLEAELGLGCMIDDNL